jgi:hypothetical protein
MNADFMTRQGVALTAQQWASVLTVLAEAPYKTVAHLIGEIQRQIMTAQQGGFSRGEDRAERT